MHETSKQESTHLPVVSSQRVSVGQVTLAHSAGTQKSFTHLKLPEHGTSPGRHLTAHCPSLHPRPDGHVAATSAVPSQSLSLPSQISGAGPTQPSQTKPRVPRHTRCPL